MALESGHVLPQPRMVKTERDERIRHAYFVEGKSIKQINRELHHDKRTVRKAIHQGE
jgi:DNA-binding NarL/FixJ family response regulator